MAFSPYDLLALGAAVCWAFTSVMSATPARHLGALAFTRWRMVLLLVMLWPVVLLSGSWHGLTWAQCGVMAISGFIGIFVGDTALFAAMNRLGPRRTSVLFATHAFFSAMLGFWFLDEHMGLQAMLGGVLVMGGVMTATLLGRHKDDEHACGLLSIPLAATEYVIACSPNERGQRPNPAVASAGRSDRQHGSGTETPSEKSESIGTLAVR